MHVIKNFIFLESMLLWLFCWDLWEHPCLNCDYYLYKSHVTMNQTHDVYQQLHSTVILAWDRLFVPSCKLKLLSFSLFGYCVLVVRRFLFQIMPDNFSSIFVKKMFHCWPLDQVWSILPALGLLPLKCLSLKCFNSNTGKMDQTWSSWPQSD